MAMFVLQCAILLALAFVLGCIAGSLAFAALRGPAARTASQGRLEPAPAMARLERQVPPLPPAEPEPSAPRPKAKRQPAESSGPESSATQEPDDLKKIRGIGRQIEIRLHNLGVHSFAQIAAWTAKDRREWGQSLAFPGRIEREDWVGQAKKLAKGRDTAFSLRVDRGEVPSSRGKPRSGK